MTLMWFRCHIPHLTPTQFNGTLNQPKTDPPNPRNKKLTWYGLIVDKVGKNGIQQWRGWLSERVMAGAGGAVVMGSVDLFFQASRHTKQKKNGPGNPYGTGTLHCRA